MTSLGEFLSSCHRYTVVNDRRKFFVHFQKGYLNVAEKEVMNNAIRNWQTYLSFQTRRIRISRNDKLNLITRIL